MKNCKISISYFDENGNKKEKEIGNLENYNSFEDIKRLIKELPKEKRDEIFGILPNIQEVNTISLSNLSNNLAGVYTPANLLNDLKRTNKTVALNLNINQEHLNKPIVISGFAPISERTQFTGKHIFLNLNYLGNSNNTLLALFETALYLNTKNYKESVDKLLDLNVSRDEKKEIVLKAFKNSGNSDLNFETIQSIYDHIAINKESFVEENDVLNIRSSISDFIDNFKDLSKAGKDLKTSPRELNYMLSEKASLNSLKPGDLISVSFDLNSDSVYKYELFYDYYIDNDNNIIVKTYSEGDRFNNRVFKYDNNKLPIVYVRRFNNVVKNINKTVTDKSKLEINLTEIRKFSKYGSTQRLIKEHGVLADGKKIKSIKGSVLTLDDNSTINIGEVKIITTNLGEINLLSYEKLSDVNNLLKIARSDSFISIPLNSKVLLERNGKFIEGLVVNRAIQLTSKGQIDKLVVLTKENGVSKIEYINSYDVKYMFRDDANIVTVQEKNKTDKIIDTLYPKNSENNFLVPKKGALLDSEYSIEKINKLTNFEVGDIIYEYDKKKHFKVVSTEESIILSGEFAGEISYFVYSNEYIRNGIKFSKENPNYTFAVNYFMKNSFQLGTFIHKNDDIISIEVKDVYQRPNGDIYITSTINGEKVYTKQQDANDKNITKRYKELMAKRYNTPIKSEDPIYFYKHKNGSILHDKVNTNYYDLSTESFSGLTLSDVIENLIPGTFLTFKGNAKAFVVERVANKSAILTAYHYGNNEIRSTGLNHVISERFELNSTSTLGVPTALFVPKWAGKTITVLNNKIDAKTKKSLVSKYSKTDSPEIINELVNYLSNTFGVKVNMLDQEQIMDIIGRVEDVAAFVYNGEIYLNTDKATIAEPLHEFLHLILATLKAKDSDKYYNIINSIENHGNFKKYAELYSSEIEADKYEEIFVKILSDTFKENITKKGIFNEEVFNQAFNDAVKDILALKESLEFKDSFELMGKSLEEIMTEFSSSILEPDTSLIDNQSVINMLNYSGTIKELIESGNLTEHCV